jgi:hypothetical protein
MLHDPKSDCNQELFGGAKGADGRARNEPRGGKGLREKRKTAHVTFYLKCYMDCRAFFLLRPCRVCDYLTTAGTACKYVFWTFLKTWRIEKINGAAKAAPFVFIVLLYSRLQLDGASVPVPVVDIHTLG